MKSTSSLAALILTGAIIAGAMTLLSTGRLEYCGQPEALRPRINLATRADTRWPTLAPPQKEVVVQIEADRPDLEIGWVEN
jgi:hypothetical protein